MFQPFSISTVKQIYVCGERWEDMRIMVAVFAISRKHASIPGRELGRLWSDRPAIKFGVAKQESVDETIVAWWQT